MKYRIGSRYSIQNTYILRVILLTNIDFCIVIIQSAGSLNYLNFDIIIIFYKSGIRLDNDNKINKTV